jgi:hypothetical protein
MVDRVMKHFEPLIAALLGIAAIATAFAAYQSAQKGDIMAEKLTEASVGAGAAFFSYTNGIQKQFRDEEIWFEYEKSYSTDDIDFAKYIRSEVMDGNLRQAIRDMDDVESETTTPLNSPKYANELIAEGDKQIAETEKSAEAAQAADQDGDRYDLVTVILAVALFFFGLAGVLRAAGTRLVLTGVGTVILGLSLVLLATV